VGLAALVATFWLSVATVRLMIHGNPAPPRSCLRAPVASRSFQLR
jgi:hypothetical protein